jgi:threonyl-tRNA synthetase
MGDRKTPREILIERGQLEKDVIAVNASGRVVDLLTPIDAGTTLEPIRASDAAGLRVIRHSSAHVMADAVQRLFPGTKVTIGPAIDDGFYYDFAKAGSGTFSDEDLGKIEKTMIDIIKRDTPFVREVVSRQDAIDQFTKMGETFKVEIIHAIPEGEEVSL